jgi:hypothetical protein
MIKSEYEILKLSRFNAQRFERNYSSCAGRSSENLYPSTGGTQEKKERQGETQETIKIDYGSQKLIYQFLLCNCNSQNFEKKSNNWS